MQIKTTTHADRQTDRHRNVSPDSSDNRNYVIQTTPFIQAKVVQSLRQINTLFSYNKSP